MTAFQRGPGRYMFSVCLLLVAAGAIVSLAGNAQAPVISVTPPDAASMPNTGKKPEVEKIMPKSLGYPCQNYHFLSGVVAYNPETGRNLMALAAMCEVSPLQLVFVDYKSKEYTDVVAPSGSGAWAMALTPSGKQAVVGVFFTGHVLLFDFEQWTFVADVEVPDAPYIWNFTPGGDGRMYFGVYGGGRLFAFDLETKTVESCGSGLPPNSSLRWVSTLPDGRILCAYGAEQPGTRIYDPASKQYSEPPDGFRDIIRGVTWNGFFLSGNRVFDRNLKAVNPPPFPLPPGSGDDWSVIPETVSGDQFYLRKGNTIYRYRKGESDLILVCDMDLKGGRVIGVSAEGGLYGVRGPQFFHIAPGADAMDRRTISAKVPYRPPAILIPDNVGNVWGAPPLGATLFMMNDKTGVATNTGMVVDGDGVVKGLTAIDGTIFGVVDPGGELFRLNPAEPWEQFSGKNPRTIARLRERGLKRCDGGIVAGPGGKKVYSGWTMGDDMNEGAVAVTDPESGETEIILNPLGKAPITGIAVDDNFIYLLTGPVEGTKGQVPVQFGAIGVDTHQVCAGFPLEGATSAQWLTLAKTKNTAVFAVDGGVRMVNIERMRLIGLPSPPPPTPTAASISWPGGSSVYYVSDTQVIQMDPTTGVFSVIAELPRKAQAFCGVRFGDLYAACGAEVLRIPLL